ncbi:ABC transporter permease [Streptomyces sp. NPDC088745]|uniref:ABC transporter permease n=1 Tax=Streptomyces sp. NPDC088745 TaxID=3365884 RepID=UPI00382E26C0
MSALDDLRLGARFAVSGGREGWIRTILTAVGVGLGVSLLLITAAIPNALAARDERGYARGEFAGRTDTAGRNTLLLGIAQADFRDLSIRGRLVQAEGPDAPVPPGLTALPGPGELAVSPELRKLLDSDAGALLRERLKGTVTAVISDEGLLGPHELSYFQGTDRLVAGRGEVVRLDAFEGASREGLDSTMMLLVLVALVVLLVPVAVLIAAAVRFGGERRDRRLAALRLVGADARSTRWVAAGETFVGALGGLLLGGGLFFLARSMARLITLESISVFPSDLVPAPWLVLLICGAVPASAVLVTLLALRGVVIEPLGVVRTAKPVRRRLWWRLLLPAAGLALLVPQIRRGDAGGNFDQFPVVGGTALLLIGVTALLPWVVESVVSHLGRGPLSWQLAIRRLQLSSGTAARAVNGIAVAVAGAIALQMLLGSASGRYTTDTSADKARADVTVAIDAASPAAPRADRLAEQLAGIPGVRVALRLTDTTVGDAPKESQRINNVTVGDCPALRQIAELPSCRDGDAFLAAGEGTAGITPGKRYYLDPEEGTGQGRAVPWTLPAGAATVPVRAGGLRDQSAGILATPGAMPAAAAAVSSHSMYLKVDPAAVDATEHARNALAAADPLIQVYGVAAERVNDRFDQIRRAVLAGSTCVLLLIGASLLISQLEQLRERRKLLAALVAFGTRRTTLGWSVLWQSALPVGLGLLLAVAVGYGLGAVLLLMTGFRVGIDWNAIGAMSGLGAGVVLLVTLLSMPALWRLMRPEGLRTE